MKRAPRTPLLNEKELLPAFHNEVVGKNPFSLMHIPKFRALLATHRFVEATGEDRKILAFSGESKHVKDFAISHNINSLVSFDGFDRPQYLINSLFAVDYIRANFNQLRILAIGPRSEYELFSLFAAGANPKNVKAIDLISYSDFIEIGDAHKMPYEDNSFDLILLGWVYPYSSDNIGLSEEVMRVADNNAYVAIGVRAEPTTHEWEPQARMAIGGVPCTSEDPERPGKTKTVHRFMYGSQITKMFEKRLKRIVVDGMPDERCLVEGKISDIIQILQLC